MSRQFFKELLAWIASDGTAVANSTTETVIFPDQTIPAFYMGGERALVLEASGKLSTTATPTITFRLRWGGVAGVVLWATGAITNGSGVTNLPWWLRIIIQTRTSGATGTIIAHGPLILHTSATAVAENIGGVAGVAAPAPATVDTTTDKGLSLTAQWSAASASNTLTGLIYHLTSPN